MFRIRLLIKRLYIFNNDRLSYRHQIYVVAGALKFCREASNTTPDKLMRGVQAKSDHHDHKVSVVGVGQVGMAIAFGLLTKRVTNHIALFDVNADKLKGEELDLRHGSTFLKSPKIKASTDFAVTADSRVCIVTAGVAQRADETRIALVQRNTEVLEGIIPPLVKHSPKAIIIIVSNPVDVLTYVAWKLSGLSKFRVIGSGTNLDSARFRYLLSKRLGIAGNSCHGYIIGEHGDSSVPVWSGVNIAGVRLRDIHPDIGKEKDPEHWDEVHRRVVDSAYEVIRLKGYTSWAVGLSVTQIVRAILANQYSIHAVSMYIKGEHGVSDEVFLSLPCVLGAQGVVDVVRQPLTDTERGQLHASAAVVAKVQAGIKF